MKQRLITAILLTILLTACSGTYTINQRGISFSWPEVPAQGEDPTPTIEATVTVVPSTPAPPLPTNEPLPALLPLSDNLRVRTCPGLGCEVVGTITRIHCLEFDHRAYSVANGIVWVQVQGSNFGTGVWVAFKNVGANGTPYARAFGDFRCINAISVSLP